MASTLSSAKPRALMIAPAMPAEGGHGLAMRLGMFLEALAGVAEVDLAVLPVAAQADAPSPLVARLGVRTAIIPCIDRPDTNFALLSRLKDPDARLEAFVRYGRPSLAAISLAAIKDLHEFTQGRAYDLVHVGRGYMAPAAQRWFAGGAKLSLDLDDDDCTTLESIARLDAAAGRGYAAAWGRAEAAAHDRLAAEFAQRFDALWVAGSPDRLSLKSRHPTLDPVVLPNAAPPANVRPRVDDGNTLLFVGSLGYVPNVDAVLWFAQSVWPALRAKAGSRLRLFVVGRNPPPAVRALRNRAGITVAGWVDDLASVYARSSLAILPFRAGGGTRIKLLEAASHGVPVVTTRAGAAGLPVERFRCGWIADGAQNFAAACLRALADAAGRRRRGANGRAMVRQAYARAAVVRGLSCAFAALLNK